MGFLVREVVLIVNDILKDTRRDLPSRTVPVIREHGRTAYIAHRALALASDQFC